MAALLVGLAGAPATADTLTCRDGLRYTGVITGETATHVLIRVGGAEVFLARSTILSVQKSAPDENRAIESSWERLNARFKDENAQVALQPPPPSDTPPPAEEPAVEPAEEAAEEPVEEYAEEPPPAPEPEPGPVPVVQQRLAWKREVRTQIYQKNVVPGMTQREVRSAWGWPDLTHPVHGVYDYTDRWVYKRPEGRAVVYFRDGAVVNVNENVGILGY